MQNLGYIMNRLGFALGGMGGASTLLQPSFLFVPTDAGGGVSTITLARGGVSPTYTRATPAATKLSTGLWKLDVASGSPRFAYSCMSTAVGSALGYLAEGARTNSCLQARDFTNASWVKTSITAAKTSTGIDGAANSCSRLTATGANGTALQAITLASAAKAYSIWIKRITGTGEIDITLDNGSTWTNITAQINSTDFTLVQATQTLANPTVGVRIVTNGDAIDVDVSQNEDTASFASSPIVTTAGAVTRNADVLTYPLTGWYNTTAGTLFAQWTPQVLGQRYIASIEDVAGNELIGLRIGSGDKAEALVLVGGATQAVLVSVASAVVGTTGKSVVAASANDFALSFNGAAVLTDTSGSMPTPTRIGIGTFNGGQHFHGTVSRIAYFPRRLPNSMLVSLTS